MKALIIIDYTVDFVDGKLPCGEPGIAIETRMCEITEAFVAQQDFVVMAVDLRRAGPLSSGDEAVPTTQYPRHGRTRFIRPVENRV